MWRILSGALILALAVFGLPAAQPVYGAGKSVLTVTNTNDDGVGSLRRAIKDANSLPGADTIAFNIPLTDPGCSSYTGVCTIFPTVHLPLLIGEGGVTVDGYTQPGAAYATSTIPANLKIRLDGSLLPAALDSFGIGITSTNNTVRGLVLIGFPAYAVGIGSVFSDDAPYTNTVSGNFIGVNVDGITPGPNGLGVVLLNGSFSNIIGGDSPAERNIISGNTYEGVTIYDEQATFNLVSANYIGLDASGTTAVPNGRHGVLVYGGADHNFIGFSNVPAWRNVIAGNLGDNVQIKGANTTQNAVAGNFIGTDASGMNALGGDSGVYIADNAVNNLVGGSGTGKGNLISGNGQHGIILADSSVTLTRIRANWIGLDASGENALPNNLSGVYIANAPANYVGWTGATDGNVISGNTQNGLVINGDAADSNRLYRNWIGTNPTGTAAIPNGWNGIYIGGGADDNRVGGEDANQGNLVSGNLQDGVRIGGVGTDGNLVKGNLIGLTADGLSPLGNQDFGVAITDGAESNIVGGDDLLSDGSANTFSRNIISGNDDGGVFISSADYNQVIGNYIGTDISGLAAFSAGAGGVFLQNGAAHNLIGDCDEFKGNVISGNPGAGVVINMGDADGNFVACNDIGLAADGLSPLGNEMNGVTIGPNASQNEIGDYNRIAYNGNHGVYVYGADSDGNDISKNSIFGNSGMGIELFVDGNNNMPAPEISAVVLGAAVDSDEVSGTACASCRVELFSSQFPDGQGAYYQGTTTAAADGTFTLSGVRLRHPYLTATAWRVGDGTSEFSALFVAPYEFIYLPQVSR